MGVGESVSDNLVIIIVPLFALLALCIQFIVIPIFAGMIGSGSASSGLMSMSDTIASFTPIYGIGLAIGMLVMFFGHRFGFIPLLPKLPLGSLGWDDKSLEYA